MAYFSIRFRSLIEISDILSLETENNRKHSFLYQVLNSYHTTLN